MVVSICRCMDVFVTLGVCVCTCDCVIFGFLFLYIMLVRLHIVQNKLNIKGFTVTGCDLTCCGKICNAESQISSQFIVRLLEGASNTSVIHAAILIELDLQQTYVR